jgi:hypothetical protein
MKPVITIDYPGQSSSWGHTDPNFPHTPEQIQAYVSGFITTAKAVIADYPSAEIIFEPINEPWGYTEPVFNAADYARIIGRLLPEASHAGIPLNDIYVGAFGENCLSASACFANDWVRGIYAAEPALASEIQGWYFHPYGQPAGLGVWDNWGIETLPVVRTSMLSGQNNIIASEVGYCALDVNGGGECSNPRTSHGYEAAADLTEMLEDALPYHEAGWLKALIIYSRGRGGWAMQLPGGSLTPSGEALIAFADAHPR